MTASTPYIPGANIPYVVFLVKPGASISDYWVENGIFYINDVEQAVLDAAVATYDPVAANAWSQQQAVDIVNNRINDDVVLVSLTLLILDQFNVLRNVAGLPTITVQQLRAALTAKITDELNG